MGKNARKIALAGSLLVAALSVGASQTLESDAASKKKLGTRIVGEKTATPFYELDYSWSVEKTGPTGPIITPRDQEVTLNYRIVATRSVATEVKGVRGDVCVQNVGKRRTRDLRIVDSIKELPSLSGELDVSEIAPGQESCFGYEFRSSSFAPGANYTNRARVSITNFIGHVGTAHGFTTEAPFTFPSTATTTDETATVVDEVACPTGFNCGISFTETTVSGAETIIEYTIKVTNVSAECTDHTLRNLVTLRETDSEDEHFSDHEVTLTYPCVTPTPTPTATVTPTPTPTATPNGCARTPGYWLNHEEHTASLLPQTLGNGGGTSVVVSDYDTAAEIFLMEYNGGSSSNPVSKLYRHCLATKLNIENGTNPSSISATLDAVDDFLTTHNQQSTLTQAERDQVEAWKDECDAYNNGNDPGGPSACNGLVTLKPGRRGH